MREKIVIGDYKALCKVTLGPDLGIDARERPRSRGEKCEENIDLVITDDETARGFRSPVEIIVDKSSPLAVALRVLVATLWVEDAMPGVTATQLECRAGGVVELAKGAVKKGII